MGAKYEVQKALFTALSGAGLRVYDFAPQSVDGGSAATWPYVEVGWINLAEWDTFTELGFNFLARIHTRSRTGAAEADTIQSTIYTTLHRQPLTITGQQTILLTREMSDCTRQPDGSFHGVCEYRGLIQTT